MLRTFVNNEKNKTCIVSSYVQIMEERKIDDEIIVILGAVAVVDVELKLIGLLVPANFLYYAVHVNRLPARQPSPPTTP